MVRLCLLLSLLDYLGAPGREIYDHSQSVDYLNSGIFLCCYFVFVGMYYSISLPLRTYFLDILDVFFMQEVGCNHAQSVGFSTDGFATTPTMRKLHLIWVTARMHIEIYKYPAW